MILKKFRFFGSLIPSNVFMNSIISFNTRVSINRGVEHELSLIWGPEQNQSLHFRGCSYAGRLGHSAFLSKAYQKNTLDIGLDTLPVFVFISL